MIRSFEILLSLFVLRRYDGLRSLRLLVGLNDAMHGIYAASTSRTSFFINFLSICGQYTQPHLTETFAITAYSSNLILATVELYKIFGSWFLLSLLLWHCSYVTVFRFVFCVCLFVSSFALTN